MIAKGTGLSLRPRVSVARVYHWLLSYRPEVVGLQKYFYLLPDVVCNLQVSCLVPL